MTFVEIPKTDAPSLLTLLLRGEYPWLDPEGRPALGWIARVLEDVLKLYQQEGRPEAATVAVWQAFDALFHRRADYEVWRRLAAPAFWVGGGKPYLQPRTTTFFAIAPGERQFLQSDFQPAELRDLPRAIAYGVIGAAIDWSRQARQFRRRSGLGTRDSVRLDGADVQPDGIGDWFKAAFEHIRHDFTNATEAAIVLSCLAEWSVRDSAAGLDGEMLRLVRRALSLIDHTFDQMLEKRRIPQFRMQTIVWADERGVRYIPAKNVDQMEIFGWTTEMLGILFEQMALTSPVDSSDWEDCLTLRSSLSAGTFEMFSAWRSLHQDRVNEPLLKHLRANELYTLGRAAEAAELVNTFLAARLWSHYLTFPEHVLPRRRPPGYAYRLIKEAGLLCKSLIPKGNRVRGGLPSPLKLHVLNTRVSGLNAQVKLLEQVLDREYALSPYEFIAALNGLKKRRPVAGESDVYVTVRADGRQIEQTRNLYFGDSVASAAFDLAIRFNYVELAHDFLEIIGQPSARQIYAYAHALRLAFQWGNGQIDVARVEHWLQIGEGAMNRCRDFGTLPAVKRWYCHEIFTGRHIKAARISGNWMPAAVENEEQARLNIGFGEITQDDLGTRLKEMSGQLEGNVFGVSLYLSESFLSAIYFLPRENAPLGVGPVTVIQDVASFLRSRMEKRAQWQLDCGNDPVKWPADILTSLAQILKDAQQAAAARPSHILLAVNALYQSLPWQQAFGLAAQILGWEGPAPAVAILPNFAFLMPTSRIDVRREPEVLILPDPATPGLDPIVSDALSRMSGAIATLEATRALDIAVFVAHGPEGAAGERDVLLPQLRITSDTFVAERELERATKRHEVVFMGACGTGVSGMSYLYDIGGLVGRFLSVSAGLLFAPIAPVTPAAVATLVNALAGASGRKEVMSAYVKATLENPECLLFNLYGTPMPSTRIGERAKLSGNIGVDVDVAGMLPSAFDVDCDPAGEQENLPAGGYGR